MEHLLHATARAEATHFWFRGFRRFVSPLLAHAASGRTNLRLLDCGCGTGNNLALLAPYGRAFGFDLTEIGLHIGREEGRSGLLRASVNAVPFPSNAFDIVTSFDVLYSLSHADEARAAAEMYRVLRPGGWALVNVAAMESLRGDHSVLSREQRRYTRRSLGALLTGVGFTIERLTYTNAVLVPPMMVSRAFQRWRGLSAEQHADTEIRVPPAPVNAVLSAALWMESLWLRAGSNPVGSSLLCLARKPASAGTPSA
ncbi:MAG: class I SAM-dependent methyltransferase [Acidobacteriaceae bacterium]|nr:class I SAM-dependent methyltransferase [Acidobacteriaceae bacterium]